MSNKQTINKNNSKRAISAATEMSLGNGRDTTCVPANITVCGGGPFDWVGKDRLTRSPENIAKRVAFFQHRSAQRKNPKCGKPRDRDGKMCQRCIETQRRRVARNSGRAYLKGEIISNEKLAGMVLQMRREMDKMQTRFKVWQKAVNYRQSIKYRTNAIRKKYLNPISHAQAMDYLKDTNHAFANDEA